MYVISHMWSTQLQTVPTVWKIPHKWGISHKCIEFSIYIVHYLIRLTFFNVWLKLCIKLVRIFKLSGGQALWLNYLLGETKKNSSCKWEYPHTWNTHTKKLSEQLNLVSWPTLIKNKIYYPFIIIFSSSIIISFSSVRESAT